MELQNTFVESHALETEEKISIRKRCGYFCYNSTTKEFCGRTKGSWAKICGYYIAFCLILILLFSLILYVSLILLTLEKKPVYNIHSVGSTLKAECGLSVFPMMYLKSPLIWYHTSNQLHYETYADEIQKILSAYTDDGVKKCSNSRKKRFVTTDCLDENCLEYRGNTTMSRQLLSFEDSYRSDSEPCKFDVNTLGPCAEYPYGYPEGTPCIYIKINKLLEWVPKPYTKTSKFPSNMPEEIKEQIRVHDSDKMWIMCEGYSLWDQENLQNVSYYPDQGFDPIYFPYKNEKHYQSPLVAIQLSQLNFIGVLLTLSCNLWIQGDYMIDTLVQVYIRQDE